MNARFIITIAIAACWAAAQAACDCSHPPIAAALHLPGEVRLPAEFPSRAGWARGSNADTGASPAVPPTSPVDRPLGLFTVAGPYGTARVSGSWLGAGATAPGPAANPIDHLQPGHWYEVPDSHLRAVLPHPLPPGNPKNIMAAWSGGAYDTKRDRLIIGGGGHADYAGNEIYTFDINTLKWSRAWGPSANIPPACADTLPDGNPPSKHTYDGLQYIPTIDRFWAQGGSRWRCGSGSFATWVFDFDSLTWTRKRDASTYMLGVTIAYDPVTGHVFHQGLTRLSEYDPINDTWTVRGDVGASLSENRVRTAAIDPVNRLFIVIGDGELFVWDLRTWKLSRPATNDGATMVKASAPGFVYDPVSKQFLGWAGGATVYGLDVLTWKWTRHEPASTNTVIPTAPTRTGTYGRFQYVPSKNAFVGVNSIDENVFIFRHPASGGIRVPSDTVRLQTAAGLNAPVIPPSPMHRSWEHPSDNKGVPGYRLQRGGTPITASTPPLAVGTGPSAATTDPKTDAASQIQWNVSLHTSPAAAAAAPPPPPSPPPPRGRINIPLKQWVALPAPPPWSGMGIPSGMKHVTAAYHPPSGRIYFVGGDYSGNRAHRTQSYRQETWSLSLAERFAARNDPGAGWRLDYPYCGPTGQVQPKHPDHVGWVWDAKRGLFYMVPGVMERVGRDNCPGETADRQSNSGFILGQVMSFDPLANRWAAIGPAGPDAMDTWQSVLDPVTDTIIRFGMTMRVNIYDIASQTWTVRGMPHISIWKEYLAADIPARAIYAIDGLAGRLHRYNIDTRTFTDLGAVPGDPLGTTNQTYIAWDSLNKVLFWHKEGRSFYAYHPGTRTWEALSIASDISGVNARGRLIVYDPGQNVLLLFGGSDEATPYLFLYRYGHGSGEPRSRDGGGPSLLRRLADRGRSE